MCPSRTTLEKEISNEILTKWMRKTIKLVKTTNENNFILDK
jgi:hypothetical protein